MASTSTARTGNSSSSMRIRNVTDNLKSDNQTLLADIRKTIVTMKDIAVQMEKLNRTQDVERLETAVVDLLNSHEECTRFSDVMQSVGNNYQPPSDQQLTNFKRFLEDEASKLKGSSTSNRQTNSMLRQFREAVWNVHHAGQPMPGEEQEDVVMTSTPFGLANIACPISGKSVTELAEPVRSMDCKHIFDKNPILHYMKQNTSKKCPVAGCPRLLVANRLVCDPLLLVEIEEMRSQNQQTAEPEQIEDFTALDDED